MHGKIKEKLFKILAKRLLLEDIKKSYENLNLEKLKELVVKLVLNERIWGIFINWILLVYSLDYVKITN